MDSWFNRGVVPPTRYELHYGGSRMARCFADRPKSVREMVSNAVARPPHGVALVCGEDSVTYSELDSLVGKVAGGLKALGVEQGDRVAMVIGNSIEFVVILFAIARLSAVSVPLNVFINSQRTCTSSRIAKQQSSSMSMILRTRLQRPAHRAASSTQSRSAATAPRLRSPIFCKHHRSLRPLRSRRKTPLRFSILPARPAARRARC